MRDNIFLKWFNSDFNWTGVRSRLDRLTLTVVYSMSMTI